MSNIEVIGMIGVNRERDSSRGVTVSLFGGGINPADEIPAGVDADYIAEFSQAHEDSGFDKVLIGYSSATADSFAVAGYAATRARRLGYLIAHRAGFMAPTLAARHAATLDQLCGGRIALHVISGGSDLEQRRDGDWLDHDSRYRRTGEWMDIVRRIWTEYEPFDYAGEFYNLAQAHSQVRTKQRPHVPLYFGGASDVAKEVGARYADVYALWGEPIAAIREQIADIRTRAARYGRDMRFSLSVRPILGDTEGEAWERARGILERVQGFSGRLRRPRPARETAVRWLAAAAGFRGPGRGPRPASVDAHSGRHRRSRQHHRPRRHGGAGRRVAPGLLRRGLFDSADSRLRPAAGHRGIRTGADPHPPRRGRRPFRGSLIPRPQRAPLRNGSQQVGATLVVALAPFDYCSMPVSPTNPERSSTHPERSSTHPGRSSTHPEPLAHSS